MTEPTALAAAPEQASLVEDFVDILFAPSKVFARRAGGAWASYFIVAALLGVLYFVNTGAMQGIMDAEVNRAIAKAMEANPSLTDDQAMGMRSMMEASIKWGALVILPIALLLLGLSVMLVGKVLGGTIGFGMGVMIASYAYVPRVIEGMGVAVQALLLDTSTFAGRYSFTLGVGRFLDSSGKQGLYNLLGRVDLITIWVTILVAIGLVHAAKVPKDKAIIGAVVLWVLGALPALWQLATGA
ncbi:MAG: YIP1 family protein [Gemmatimonadaceae bacterium]